MATDALGEAIESYLRTGSYDPLGMPWPGNAIERSRRAHDALMQALVAEVMRRAKTWPAPDLAEAFDGVAFTRAKLAKHVPSPAQPWKLPVGEWVRELYGKSHGTPASEPRPPEHPQEPDFVLDGSFETFEDDASWLDPDPTREEIENEDRFRLRHREAFRRAADYVAEAFARLTFVHRVVLFGSVAQPPRRETPRQRRYRRAGARLWHESKDVDLAVWVSQVSDLKALQRARGRALNGLFADLELGVAHHQVDVFLLEPRTDRYLGRLCHFGSCPKEKPECRVAGCGAALFLRQHDGFVFDPRSTENGGIVLFDRARGLPSAADDDLPF